MKMKGIVVTLITTSIFSFQTLIAASPDGADTSFKKDNPNLLYTTRDFYINLDPDCYSSNVCLQDFFLVLTFNVGMNSSQQVKQIGFKDAALEFFSKGKTEKTFVKQTFKKYEYVSADSSNVCLQDFFLVLTFNVGMNSSQQVKQIGFKDAALEFFSKGKTEKTFVKQTFKKYEYVSAEEGWNVKVVFYPDKPANAVTPAVNKFEFNGVVKQNSISGTLTFYSKTEQTVVMLN